MTREPVMDRSRLAAFADGELSPEEAAAVVMHLADHPEDQAYVDDLMAANELLGRAFAAPMAEPAPGPIRNAILGEHTEGQQAEATVVPFRGRRAVRLGGSLALAASAAFVALMLPVQLPFGAAPDRLVLGPVPEGSALAQMLDTVPTGTPEAMGEGREIMILASLPTDDGHCREIEVVDEPAERIDLGIACNRGAGWTVEVTLFEPLSATGTEDGFVTASGAEVQTLGLFLDRLGAGPALSPEAEGEAIDQGWPAP